jgi:hypothetical protein
MRQHRESDTHELNPQLQRVSFTSKLKERLLVTNAQKSVSNRIMIYKDEVLGKRVEVQFKVGSITQFFQGTVRKLKMELLEGEVKCQHFVVFDDGDEWVLLF